MHVPSVPLWIRALCEVHAHMHTCTCPCCIQCPHGSVHCVVQVESKNFKSPPHSELIGAPSIVRWPEGGVVVQERVRPHSTRLDSTRLDSTPLHSTPLHSTTLHYTTLHYTTLHYTTLDSTPLDSTPLDSTPLDSTRLILSGLDSTRTRLDLT